MKEIAEQGPDMGEGSGSNNSSSSSSDRSVGSTYSDFQQQVFASEQDACEKTGGKWIKVACFCKSDSTWSKYRGCVPDLQIVCEKTDGAMYSSKLNLCFCDDETITNGNYKTCDPAKSTAAKNAAEGK